MGLSSLLSSYRFSFVGVVLMLGVGVSLVAAFVAWRRRAAEGAKYLALLQLASAEWMFSYVFENATSDLSLKVMWSKVAYPGIASAPLLYLLFTTTYTQQARYLTRRLVAILSVVPFITFLVAVTNDFHHWLWTGFDINPETGAGIFYRGFWFWIHVAYSYCVLFVGFSFLLAAYVRFPGYYRRQIGVLVTGSVFPFIVNGMYITGLNPVADMDLTPVAFVLSGLILSWGLLRFRMLDLVPVARSALFDTMGDGVLVIDDRGRVVDVNPAMQSLIGPGSLIGVSVDRAVSSWKGLSECLGAAAGTHGEAWWGTGGQERCFDVRVYALEGRGAGIGGRLIIARDVTDRKKLEGKLERLVGELREALAQVKTLSGLVPICASCKKIRDDQGYWQSVEVYVRDRSDAEFSHSICPECARRLYPDSLTGEGDVPVERAADGPSGA